MRELIEPEGVLMAILKHHSDKGHSRPKGFPGTLREAALFWISHQEPGDDDKEAVEKIFKNGELVGHETAIMLSLGLAGAGYWYGYGQYFESTDNAYLQGDITNISKSSP